MALDDFFDLVAIRELRFSRLLGFCRIRRAARGHPRLAPKFSAPRPLNEGSLVVSRPTPNSIAIIGECLYVRDGEGAHPLGLITSAVCMVSLNDRKGICSEALPLLLELECAI